jgi:hypothetical protein
VSDQSDGTPTEQALDLLTIAVLDAYSAIERALDELRQRRIGNARQVLIIQMEKIAATLFCPIAKAAGVSDGLGLIEETLPAQAELPLEAA